MSRSLDGLVEANHAFYAAFEARDTTAMAAVWEHLDRAYCTHPGWPPLYGWGKIAASWYMLFTNQENLQFVVGRTDPFIVGEVGWVLCEENLLDEEVVGRVVSLNLFVHDGKAWKMTAHVAGPTRP
jgi:SnoaL-like domain